MRRKALQRVMAIWLALLLAMLVCSLIGCTTTKYVETIKTDTVHHYTHHYDSIVRWDSIHISEKTKGDTIYITSDRYRYRYKDKLVTDTLYITNVEKIPYMVEKELTAWQKFKISAGEWLLGGIVVLLAIFAVLWVINWRKR